MGLRSSFVAVAAMLAGALMVGLAAPPSGVSAAGCQPPTVVGQQPPATESGFHPITPVRLLDTRLGTGPVGAGCTAVVDLNVGPAATTIPTDAEAVALNITTVDAAARGFVTVYPCGSPRPSASNVNPRRLDPTANSVLVQLGPTRQVCMYTLTSLNLVVDSTGWFGRFGAPFHEVSGERVLDTRTDLRPDGQSGPLPAGTELRLPIAGAPLPGNNVPATAAAVALNITSTDAQRPGFVSVYPCGTARPVTSTVNFVANEQRANHAVVGLDSSGAVCLWSYADVHVVVDVEGWFGGDPGSGTLFRALPGTRVLDSRDGTGGISGKLQAGSTVSFDPTRAGALPIGSTVVLNVVSTEADSPGYLTLYSCSAGRPATSSVNAVVGNEATNEAFVAIAPDSPADSPPASPPDSPPDSRVCIYAFSSMHVVVDVVGTFGPGGPLHSLSISPLSLTPGVFRPDQHDYTVRCSAGPNTVEVHAGGGPGSTVSITPAGQTPAPATSATVDASLTMQENQAFVVRAGISGSTPEEYWVRCLPHDFPVLQVDRIEAPHPGWYLTEDAFNVNSDGLFIMILDGRGVPVWYHRVTSPSIDPTLLADGTLAWTKLQGVAFGSDPAGVWEVHRLDGTLVRTIKTVGGATDHHDFLQLPNGNVVLITYVPRDHVDLTALGFGFGSDELVYDGHLQEIRPDGTVAWTWRSEDHTLVTDTTFPQRFPGSAGTGVDLAHINSVSLAPDGDLVVSARHLDSVLKIRHDSSGDVVLRIGGVRSDVSFVDDPMNGFFRQHDAELLPNGHLRLFDNNTNVGAPRAVEYAIDQNNDTATLVWAVSDSRVPVSFGVGSVRTTGDGDRVIAWGGATSPAFTEVDSQGRLLQSTTIGGHFPYRVDKRPLSAFDIDVLRATAGS
ncbi:MAG: aryl-sulfate sulfotransferase [Ilumatobacteraceae bacterium]